MSTSLKNKLKLARKVVSLSQSQASKAWDIPLATLQGWERNKSTPRGIHLTLLVAMLDGIIASSAGPKPPPARSQSLRKHG